MNRGGVCGAYGSPWRERGRDGRGGDLHPKPPWEGEKGPRALHRSRPDPPYSPSPYPPSAHPLNTPAAGACSSPRSAWNRLGTSYPLLHTPSLSPETPSSSPRARAPPRQSRSRGSASSLRRTPRTSAGALAYARGRARPRGRDVRERECARVGDGVPRAPVPQLPRARRPLGRDSDAALWGPCAGKGWRE